MSLHMLGETVFMYHNLSTKQTLRYLVSVSLHVLDETGFMSYNVSTLPTLGALCLCVFARAG